MASEYLLAIAVTCLASAIVVAGIELARQIRRRTYEPRHTGEQPVVHVGATETSPLIVDLPLAEPPPPIDPATLLREARGRRVELDREIAELEALVQQRDADRVHIALDALERSFRAKLSRTGRAVHLEADTAEWRRSDIRRPVRSGA